MGALKLYLDLLLLFQYLLMLFGNRNEKFFIRGFFKKTPKIFLCLMTINITSGKKNPEHYWDDKASLIDWYEKYQASTFKR